MSRRYYRPQAERIAVGDRIRSLMEARGINQRQLSRASGVTEATVSRILGGWREPSYSTLHLLKEALGCTWTELMDGGCDEGLETGGLAEAGKLHAQAALRDGRSQGGGHR